MSQISRRAALAGTAATSLHRFAIGQADTRPVITVAVQRAAVVGPDHHLGGWP